MEAIKSGLGLAPKNTQEGTEPVSGETGKGTSTEPYDQGNADGEWDAVSLSRRDGELRIQGRRKSRDLVLQLGL